jgi:preprotein translocase SecE subunit
VEPPDAEPPRDDVPGELEHASAEVDQFRAGVVAGAGPDDGTSVSDADLEHAALEQVGDLDDDGDVDEQDRALARSPELSEAGLPTSRETKGRSAPRFLAFLRASWAELQRVQWPDRRQVAQATGVVIGFVIIAGAYLGIADWAAQRVVNFIL